MYTYKLKPKLPKECPKELHTLNALLELDVDIPLHAKMIGFITNEDTYVSYLDIDKDKENTPYLTYLVDNGLVVLADEYVYVENELKKVMGIFIQYKNTRHSSYHPSIRCMPTYTDDAQFKLSCELLVALNEGFSKYINFEYVTSSTYVGLLDIVDNLELMLDSWIEENEHGFHYLGDDVLVTSFISDIGVSVTTPITVNDILNNITSFRIYNIEPVLPDWGAGVNMEEELPLD